MAANSVPIHLPNGFNTMATKALKNWCETKQVKVVQFEYTWTINNFSRSQEWEIGKEMVSAKFSADDNDERTWYLVLYPRGDTKHGRDWLSVYLMNDFSKQSNVTVQFTISILDGKNKKINARSSPLMPMSSVCQHGFGFSRFIITDIVLIPENQILSPDDDLRILVELTTFARITTVSRSSITEIKVPECGLKDDLAVLFESKKWSDIIIVNGENELKAHKAILAMRSLVFEAMFESDMVEQSLNRVNINDIDHEVLNEMLRFIYTGRVMNLNKMADRLLVAADKYALHRLKVICEEELCTSLTIDNSTDILILADLYNAENLKAQAILFICQNMKYVMNTNGYKSILKSHPHLIDAMFRVSVMKSNNNAEKSRLFSIIQAASKLSLTE